MTPAAQDSPQTDLKPSREDSAEPSSKVAGSSSGSSAGSSSSSPADGAVAASKDSDTSPSRNGTKPSPKGKSGDPHAAGNGKESAPNPATRPLPLQPPGMRSATDESLASAFPWTAQLLSSVASREKDAEPTSPVVESPRPAAPDAVSPAAPKATATGSADTPALSPATREAVKVLNVPQASVWRAAWAKTMAVLRRRAVVLLLPAVLVPTLTWVLAANAPRSYRADAILAVREPNPRTEGSTPDPSIARAHIYAAAIPLLDGPLRSAADSARITHTRLKERLVVSNQERTTLVRLTYTGSTEIETVTVLQGLSRALTASSVPTPLLPGSLQAINVPTTVPVSNMSAPVAFVLGLMSGVGLGVLVAVVLERSRPRIDTTADLEAAISAPAFHITQAQTGAIESLRAGWQILHGIPRALVVVLVGARLETNLDLSRALSAPPAEGTDEKPAADGREQAVIVTRAGESAAQIHATMAKLNASGVTAAYGLLVR